MKRKKKKNKNLIIRSTKCSLKFSNEGKLKEISSFIDEYTKICKMFVNVLWDDFQKGNKIDELLPKDLTKQITLSTWISSRAIQCAGKQASGIVRGTIKKINQKIYVLEKLREKVEEIKNDSTKSLELKEVLENIENLEKIINKTKISKPEPKYINPELDERFIEIQKSGVDFVDLWVKISSISSTLKKNENKKKRVELFIPLKKTKHFNNLTQKDFSLKNGVRLSKKFITLNFEKEKPKKVQSGSTIGIDIGVKDCWADSRGISSTPCPHGHNLDSIQKKLSRRKKGSKSFKKAQQHRTNYINWSVKQISWDGVKQLNLEDIKDLRRGKSSSRYMSHWTYTSIFERFESISMEQGVLVNKMDEIYTSQRCSNCGWVDKKNRNGKKFKCVACGFATDADLNASINISLNLPSVKRYFLKQENRIGFYWNVLNQEFKEQLLVAHFIVPDVSKG